MGQVKKAQAREKAGRQFHGFRCLGDLRASGLGGLLGFFDRAYQCGVSSASGKPDPDSSQGLVQGVGFTLTPKTHRPALPSHACRASRSSLAAQHNRASSQRPQPARATRRIATPYSCSTSRPAMTNQVKHDQRNGSL